MAYIQEEHIVEGCLKNDREAQKALYDRYKTKMYTLSYRITNNFDDANDALQEGFLQVFKNLQSFEGKSKLGTWIHTIIARAALKKVKDKIHFADLNEVEERYTFDWNAVIDVQHLEKAIHSLPEGYRSIFTLYEIEGFKHKEIADLMNISVSTSKTQLFKAKRMLQDKLKEIK
ncbi:MAG: RNA polymerase sigma factor [Bacteroidetes bacterium]|nr:RNA polymerase sigma factor [Bacteroidota bacterium]